MRDDDVVGNICFGSAASSSSSLLSSSSSLTALERWVYNTQMRCLTVSSNVSRAAANATSSRTGIAAACIAWATSSTTWTSRVMPSGFTDMYSNPTNVIRQATPARYGLANAARHVTGRHL